MIDFTYVPELRGKINKVERENSLQMMEKIYGEDFQIYYTKLVKLLISSLTLL